jgi:hypothetical protein
MTLKPNYVIEWTVNGRDWFLASEHRQSGEAKKLLKGFRVKASLLHHNRRFRLVKVSKQVIA